MVSENNNPEEEEVVEEVIEEKVIEEVSEDSDNSDDDEIKCIAMYEQDPNMPIDLMVYTLTGIDESGVRIGPVTVVAPTRDHALELSKLQDISIISAGQYIPEE